MIIQKVFKTGNSLVITIPRESLAELKLKEGSEVFVDTDPHSQAITILPRAKKTHRSAITPEFLKWLESFNKQYGPALKELARR